MFYTTSMHYNCLKKHEALNPKAEFLGLML